jgi:hypothetical protein
VQERQPVHLLESTTTIPSSDRFEIAFAGQISMQAGFAQCMQDSEMVSFVILGNCPLQSSNTFRHLMPSSSEFQDLQATSQAWHWTHRSLSKENPYCRTIGFSMINLCFFHLDESLA